MNEKEWLSATNPEEMYRHLGDTVSERKVRLYKIACARRVVHILTPERLQQLHDIAERSSSWNFDDEVRPPLTACRDALELAERAADEPVDEARLSAAAELAYKYTFPAGDYAAMYDESWGPFDTMISATGNAAEAVNYTCGDNRYPLVAGPLTAARAVANERGQRNRDGHPDELAVQCDLLREIFGNPFRPVQFDSSWRTPSVVELARTMYDARKFDRMPVLGIELERAGCNDAQILSHCREASGHVRGCWVVDLVLNR